MNAPGITIRRSWTWSASRTSASSSSTTCASRTALIGELDRGFYQIMQQLDFERSGIERLISNHLLWRDAKAFAREQGLTRRDPVLREKIAGLEIHLRARRALIYRVAELLSTGRVHHEAAVAKTFCTTLDSASPISSQQILGHSPELDASDPRARAPPVAPPARCLYTRPTRDPGGANDVLRNIIATRGLGLPGVRHRAASMHSARSARSMMSTSHPSSPRLDSRILQLRSEEFSGIGS